MSGAVHVTVINMTDARSLTQKAVDNDEFWTFAANEWWRLYQDWVPSLEGDLYGDVSYAPKEVTHNAIYAAYQYYGGDGRRTVRNYTKTHPHAGPRWDDAAAPTQRPKLEEALENHLAGKDITE